MNGFSIIDKYTLKSVNVEDGEIFEVCNYNGKYSVIFLILYKLIILLLLLFLIFVEWSISEIIYDIRFVTTVIYIDILSFIIKIVFLIIQIKYYENYFIIQTVNIFIISIMNYIFLFGIRVLLGLIHKQNVNLQFINRNENFINNETQLRTKSTNNETINVDDSIYKTNTVDENGENENIEPTATIKSNFISRMIDYHYTNYSNDS